jgi:hypothetical protein
MVLFLVKLTALVPVGWPTGSARKKSLLGGVDGVGPGGMAHWERQEKVVRCKHWER